MYSFQTNVTSLFAQDNLRVNSEFQSKTIERLTSGLRINSSGDDAAGLAVANGYRSTVAELQQGVRNANDGVSTLQIIDGGLNNVSKILDRLKTLATQSASGTFSGDRTTLNNEYSSLLNEITRQASNIGLNAGGTNNTNIGVYIGGGNTQGNSQIHVDLSGSANQVDAAGLGISATNISGTVGSLSVGNADLRAGTYLSGNSTQALTFDLAGGAQTTVTLNGGSAGITGDEVVSQLNSQLASFGITAGKDATTGFLSLTSSQAFVFEAAAKSGAGTGVAAANTGTVNSNVYSFNAGVASVSVGGSQTISITPTGASAINVTLTNSDTANTIQSKFNSALSGSGVSVVKDSSGNLYFEGSSSFTLTRGSDGNTGGLANVASGASATITAPAASGSVTQNALAALTAIGAAITNLGHVQGKVGTGQNDLQYAIALAQSQVTNYSAAESRIRDADVASEAANLTKAQVLQQASVAALAQANSAPQTLLRLFQ